MRSHRSETLRFAASIVISVLFIAVIPLAAVWYLNKHQTDERIAANKEIIERVERERKERSAALNEFVYRQCVAGEIRDVVIVQQLQAAKRRLRALPPDDAERLYQEAVLNDGINALEPPGEEDCIPPPVTVEKGETP